MTYYFPKTKHSSLPFILIKFLVDGTINFQMNNQLDATIHFLKRSRFPNYTETGSSLKTQNTLSPLSHAGVQIYSSRPMCRQDLGLILLP